MKIYVANTSTTSALDLIPFYLILIAITFLAIWLIRYRRRGKK